MHKWGLYTLPSKIRNKKDIQVLSVFDRDDKDPIRESLYLVKRFVVEQQVVRLSCHLPQFIASIICMNKMSFSMTI